MSQTYYQNLWNESQNQLKQNLAFEARVQNKGPYKDLNLVKWLIGHLFINYIRIVNGLDKCYDQMFHPQKREVLGRLLDLALGRLLELKAEIVRIEFDDYCFFDNILIELKLTHQDMEIHIPKYYTKDKEKVKEHRRKLMNQVFAEAEREKFRVEFLKGIPENAQEETWGNYLAQEEQERIEREKLEEQQKKMLGGNTQGISSLEKLRKELKENDVRGNIVDESVVKAVFLLQRHERARQGRVSATWAKKYKRMKEQGMLSARIPDEIGRRAAVAIQRHWRKYRQRVREKMKGEKMLTLLGFAETGYKNSGPLAEKLEKVERLRRKIRDRNQKEYEEALDTVKEKVTTLYSFPMEESTVDEIRGWFMWFLQKTNYFPDFPPEKPIIPTGDTLGYPKKLSPEFIKKMFPPLKNKKPSEPIPTTALGLALAGLTAIGGSALVAAEQWIGPQEFLICQKEIDKMKKAGKGGDKKKEMSKEEKMALKKKAKEEEKKRLQAEAALGFQLKKSNFMAPMKKADRDYWNVWHDLDETNNYEQRFIYAFVKDDKCYELSMEIRYLVDEFMRLELEILKRALERDKNPKAKQKNKKAKPKKEKKKKKKEKPDPTGDRTLDDIFLELFRNGIIRDYEEVYLKDYICDKSYGSFEFRQRLIDRAPSSGDVKDLIIQLCILPLASSRIHQLGPLIKSVCLMGSENSGKEFLARIICTETAAVMFDLTPANVVGKYPGKNGLKMLQHLIEKMSRALQPSVIFVDGAEKPFYKKVPKEQKDMDPKRIGSIIPKLVKGIKPTDQVLLVGVCSQPWLAKRNKLLKTYQKLIFVPQMDYGSYVRTWQALLRPYRSISKSFDMSCLARASYGYSVKAIMDAIHNVMNIKRISLSFVQQIVPKEFLEELVKDKPTDEASVQKCQQFYAGTELPKKRAKRLKAMREEIEKSKKKV